MYKQWVKKYFIFGISFAICFILFNFIIDPYGVFGHNCKVCHVKNHTASRRMTKVYYIKRLKPKTILIGTSRIGVINPKYVEHFTKNRVYNLSLSASSIKEQYEYIKFTINKIKIKNLIWGIDFFSFNPDAKLPYSFSKKRLEKDFFLQDYIDSLLTIDAFLSSLATLKDNYLGKKQKVNFLNGQNYFLPHKACLEKYGISCIDKKIKEGLKGYKKTLELYGSKSFKKPSSIDKNFIYIQKVVKLCKKKKVKLYLYISPIYYKTILLIKKQKLLDTFKYMEYRLFQIYRYKNFIYNTNIILNKNNFWDNSHMREKVGNFIIKNIFNKKKYRTIKLQNIDKLIKELEIYEKENTYNR